MPCERHCSRESLPFFSAVEDIFLAILALDSRRSYVGNVRSSIWFCDCYASSCFTTEEVRQILVLQLLATIFDEDGYSKCHARGDACAGSSKARACHLVIVDEIVKIGEVLYFDCAQDIVYAARFQLLNRQWRGQGRYVHARVDKRLEDMLGHRFLLFPFERVLCKILCDELSTNFLPFLELGRIVRRGKTAEVGRFAEWNWWCIGHVAIAR